MRGISAILLVLPTVFSIAESKEDALAALIRHSDHMCGQTDRVVILLDTEFGKNFGVRCDGRYFYLLVVTPRGRTIVEVDPNRYADK